MSYEVSMTDVQRAVEDEAHDRRAAVQELRDDLKEDVEALQGQCTGLREDVTNLQTEQLGLAESSLDLAKVVQALERRIAAFAATLDVTIERQFTTMEVVDRLLATMGLVAVRAVEVAPKLDPEQKS